VERCWANVGSSCWFHENWSERWLLPWNNRDGPSYSSLPNLHHVLYLPMNISTQFLELEWRSPAMSRPAMFIPDLAAPPAPCSSSLLDAATHPSDEQLPPCMLPAASGRRGSPSTSMPCSCLRPLLAGGSLTSTPLSPFSTRLTPPARGCTAAVSGLYLRVHAKNCKLPTTSCCLGHPLLLATLSTITPPYQCLGPFSLC
jgi:hypothetical protein